MIDDYQDGDRGLHKTEGWGTMRQQTKRKGKLVFYPDNSTHGGYIHIKPGVDMVPKPQADMIRNLKGLN